MTERPRSGGPCAPRYTARMLTSGRFTYPAIYDNERRSYPAILGGRRVPDSFATLEEAQAWADEHLNATEGTP